MDATSLTILTKKHFSPGASKPRRGRSVLQDERGDESVPRKCKERSSMSSTTFEATPGLARRVDDWLVSSGPTLAGRLNRVATGTGRWGLVLILLGLGLYKFTATEAQAIVPLVSNSPLMAWLYEIGSVRAISAGIGVVEIVIALLLALHRWSPKAAAAGGLMGMAMFATTLSFLHDARRARGPVAARLLVEGPVPVRSERPRGERVRARDRRSTSRVPLTRAMRGRQVHGRQPLSCQI